ncbi:MAG: hypothetical protein DME57_06910, partial [Verrucomicrobia bacterium]
MKLGAERELRQFHFQLLRRNSIECARHTYFAILGHGRNERFAFGINQKRASFRRMSARALRRVNCDLTWND